MYQTFLLLIIHTISTAAIGISNVDFSRGRLLGRQGNSCTGGCPSTEQCCAGVCISTDLDCCPDGNWYCPEVEEVCKPCPSGKTCYDNNDEVTPWLCCLSSGVCNIIFSSGTGLVTVVSSIGSTFSSMASPTTTTTTPSPSVTTTPVSTPAAQSSSTVIATSSIRTTPSQPITSTIIAHSFVHSSLTQTTTQTSVSIVLATSNTAPVVTSPGSSLTTHSSIPTWNGSGPLLVGYCATPEFSLVYGPQTTAVYFIGIVGCMGDKTDCCPFQVSSTTITTTFTQGVPPNANQYVFPGGTTSSEDTLPRCPDDYVTVSSVCCPSGYILWEGGSLGGITPCYSTVSNYLTPPPAENPSTVTISSSPVAITSTVVNVVYARNYPVNSTQTSLTTSAKAGIGAGVGVGVIALAGLALWFLAWRKRRPRASPYPSGGGSSPMQIIPPVQPP